MGLDSMKAVGVVAVPNVYAPMKVSLFRRNDDYNTPVVTPVTSLQAGLVFYQAVRGVCVCVCVSGIKSSPRPFVTEVGVSVCVCVCECECECVSVYTRHLSFMWLFV